MPQPGLGSIVPPGDDHLAKKLADLQRQIDELRTARSGNAMTIDGAPGIVVKGGGQIELDGGDLKVTDGDVIADGGNVLSGNFEHLSAGWRLQPGGNAEFNDITLRGGIIGNEALTNPISPDVRHSEASPFSLSTTLAEKARATFTVPADFTSALVLGAMRATAINSGAGRDYIKGEVDIQGGATGYLATHDGDPGYAIGISHVATALLTGLSGGDTFYVRAMVGTGSAGWASDPFNTVNVDALVLFFR